MFSQKYQALLSPLKIRDTILRNRMLSSASTPHFLQGVEPYPTEKVITHFANRARNGAAAVTVNHFHTNDMPKRGRAIDVPPAHFNLFDLGDLSCQNYLCQLVDAIHFHGARATGYLMADPGWFSPDGKSPAMPPMDEDMPSPPQEGPMIDISGITQDMINNFIRNVAQEAKDLKSLGFDIISMHCCYRHSPQACFLSPLTNHRKDNYGGSLENRARLILDTYRAMRRAVGESTLLEIVISVSEPEGGYTVSDTIEFARMADGLIDILHLRSGELDPQHPLGFTSTEAEPAPFLADMGMVTQAVRAAGLPMVVAASAGFQNLDHANQAVADGQADLIAMARSWINNPDYGRLAYEGRGEDVVPCVRCNKCHVPNGTDMFRSVCTVNPRLGLEDKLDRMISPPQASLRTAVIGGGPAGLQFALTAAERGHQVTLYETANRLGGQMNHADYPSFKWPMRQFKEFMASRMDRFGVDVRLGVRATPAMLARENFDAVAVAIGSQPCRLCLPGSDGANVFLASELYGTSEDKLADEIVMIGGGDIGVETALYLCELGKKVTVLEMLPELIPDAPHAHYKSMVQRYWQQQPNFKFKCGIYCTVIEKDGVRYQTQDGSEGKAAGGSIVIAVGSKPRSAEAMAFAGTAPRLLVIGDCDSPGSVQKAIRQGFAAACSI